MHRLVVEPPAVAEAAEARAWYAIRSVDAAKSFDADLAKAMARIIEAPHRWPRLGPDARRCRLQRFPFLIVYILRGNVVKVIAIAHTHRGPDFWEQQRFGGST